MTFGCESAAIACASRSKPGAPLGVGGKALGENLDRDVAMEAGVPGAEDFAHSTGADGGDDLIRTETGTWTQRHRDGL